VSTDTSEKGLESLIVAAMAGQASGEAPPSGEGVSLIRGRYGGTGWILGQVQDYDREFCVDLPQLRAFLSATQLKVAESLNLNSDSPSRRKFLARLQGEVSKRGVIEVLRHGIKDGPHHIDFFYGTPSPGNEKAAELYAANRFSVTRQLAVQP
jgi:type I restriction enzyme R subunit